MCQRWAQKQGMGAEVSDRGPMCSEQDTEQTIQMYPVLLVAFNPHHSPGLS